MMLMMIKIHRLLIMHILTIAEPTLTHFCQDPSAIFKKFIHDPYQSYPMVIYPN